jgi:hypothetical protein
MKKKQFFADFIIEGKKFSMELEVTKSGYRSWEIVKDGFFIGSVSGDRVISRDSFIDCIGQFFSDCLLKQPWSDNFFIAKSFKPVSVVEYYRDCMHKKEWTDGHIEWQAEKRKMEIPDFCRLNSPCNHPRSYAINKVNALGVLITWLKDNDDEIKQKLTIFNAAKKYGI